MGRKYNENDKNNDPNDNINYYLRTNSSNYNPIYTNDLSEIKKPRHSNPDTLSYLSAIPLQTILNEEEKDISLKNIITEIEHEIASLATVEKGSQFLEQVIQNTSDTSLLQTILSGFLGYIVYLSTNRFGSHVLQTILHKITKETSMKDYLLEINNELKPYIKELMVHVCGTHVLRSFLCALGGVTLMKQKRKMDVIQYDTENYVNNNQECFYDFVEEVIYLENVQEYICHNSASPFLNIALQVLAYHDNEGNTDIISIKESSKSHEFIQNILQNKTISEYSEDNVGSTILETIFQYKLPSFPTILQDINLTSFLQHNIANHILQSMLLSPSMTPDLLSTVFQQMETNTINEINCLKYCLLHKNRRGVFWRLCCICAKFQLFVDKLIHCIQSTFYDGEDQKKKKKKTISIQACISKLIFDGERMDANGARIINTLMQFYDSSPKSVLNIIDGILNLDTKQLDQILKDGTISRYIIDGILEHPHSQELSSYIQKLYLKKQGSWVYYAIDRIGKFTLLKLYPLLTHENQFLLVKELAEQYGRLQGCGLGKYICGELGVDVFIEGEHLWKQKFLKGKDKKSKKRKKEEVSSKDEHIKNEDGDGSKKKKKKKKKKHD